MEKLTPRDVISAGGAVTDELLEPFVSGDSDEEREQSRKGLRQAVAGSMSFFSRLTTEEKDEQVDVPIITLGGNAEKKTTTTTSRTRSKRKRSRT